MDHDDPFATSPTGPDSTRSRKARLDPRAPESDPADAFEASEPPEFLDLPDRPRPPAYPTGLDDRGAMALARLRLTADGARVGQAPGPLPDRATPAPAPGRYRGPAEPGVGLEGMTGGRADDRGDAPRERTPRLAGALDPGDPIRSGPDHPLVDLNRRMLEGITELVRLQGQVGRQGLPR